MGEILTASVSGIADADGLTNPGYTYQWIRVVTLGGGTSNIAGATGSTYTLTGDDVTHRVRVRVMFTDDDGTAETVTSDDYPSSGAVLSLPSAPRQFIATAGDGRARLRWSNPSNIGGVDVTRLRYQYRYAPGATVPDGTVWSNATHFVQRRQLFDGLTNGTAYAFEVRAVNTVGPGPPATATATPMTVACPAPSLGNRRQHWRGELTIDAHTPTPPGGEAPASFGFVATEDPPRGSLSDTDFTLGAQAYGIIEAWAGDFQSFVPGYLVFGFDRDLTEAHRAALRLHVCGTAYDFSDALGPFDPHEYAWPDDLDWEVLRSRTLYLSLPPNNAASGKPAVTGTAQTAEVLTAAKGTIADADGLTLADATEAGFAYTYQWLRVDSDGTSNPTDIPGATGARYTVTAADMGKKLKVRVSFTDDFNANEARTSDAYPSSGTVSLGKVVIGFRGVSVPEGVVGQLSFPEDVGAAVLTAYLDRSPETALSVPWFTSDQTAVSPDDYTGGQGTLTFAPGETEQTIALPIVDDAIREDPDPVFGEDESLLVALEFGDDYRLKNSGLVMVLILDNDGDDAVANSFPTASDGRVTALENQDYTFTAADFNYSDSDADPLASVTIKLLPASGTGTLKLDNANVRQDATVTRAQLDAGSFKYTPPPDQTGTGVAFFLFAVSDGAAESTSVYRMTIDVAEATSAPGPPQNLTAVPGSGAVALNWEAPSDPGSSAIVRYEVRHAAGEAVPPATAWESVGLTFTHTVTGLANGQRHTFEVRAVNGSTPGEGPAAQVQATPSAAGRSRGVTVSPTALTVTKGTSRTYTAKLNTQPTESVTVTPSSSNTKVTFSPASLTFTTTNWNTAQTVTVTAAQDAADAASATISHAVAGGDYGPVPAASVAVTVKDVGGGGAVGPSVPGAPASLTATAGDEEVALVWSAPADDDGTPVTGYEYRFAAGTTVPGDTPWQSAGLDLEWTVTGLTNGQQYAFEVRASNRVGEGEARGALATPVGAPGALASLTATAGDEEVALVWSAPADDGGSPVTGYEYRYAAGQAVPEDVTWRDAGTELTATVSGLENETRYTFEVRARNRVGPGETSGTTALPLRLRAELFSSAAAEGEALVVGVRRSGGLAFPAHASIGVTDSALPGVTATEEGRDDGLGRHRLEFAAGAAEATVTVTVAFDGERRQDRVLSATLDSAELEVDGVRRPYELVTPTLVVPVTEGDAGLSVADARVQGKSSVLAFTVSLDRTRDVAVRVDYATEDGAARAGEDYTPVSGTLTIEAGGRERTVEVPVLPALHVTGERTLTLRLSNAVSAVIDDGVATGTIVRESELPKAWLARFGRTASDHAAQAIARRLEAGQRETQVTVAGRRVDGLSVDGLLLGVLPSGGWRPASAVEDMATRLAAPALAASGAPFGGVDADPGTPGLRAGTWGGAPGALDREPFADAGQTLRRAVLPDFAYRLPGAEEALMGTSFYVERGAQQDVGGGTWAAWGDVAATRFEGDAGGLALNGDVVTGTAGLDRQWRAVLVGLALSRSSGEGGYGTGAGTIASTLTSVHPYVQVRLGERAQVWGAAGWGRGGLEITPESGAALEADLRNSMAAAGARAVLMGAGGLEIALRSDFLWTETSSDGTAALAEAVGTASRGRLMLEGAGQIQGLGGVVRPKVEGGVRYDGGDAETGQGFEVGGGLDWARGSLTLQVNGRMLVAHADESYEEWGYSGSLVYEPGADGLGLQMRVGSSAGAAASGIRNLWALENASGLVRGGGMPFAQRFDA